MNTIVAIDGQVSYVKGGIMHGTRGFSIAYIDSFVVAGDRSWFDMRDPQEA
jgi:hypothetical protein